MWLLRELREGFKLGAPLYEKNNKQTAGGNTYFFNGIVKIYSPENSNLDFFFLLKNFLKFCFPGKKKSYSIEFKEFFFLVFVEMFITSFS